MNKFYKHLTIVITFIVILLQNNITIHAQLTIPKEIQSFVNEKYPDATEIVWQKSIFKYMASFKNDNGESCFIEFSSAGNWKYTKIDILYKGLPEDVIKTYENSLYDSANGWHFSSADKFESPEIPFAYRLHIYKGPINKKAVYISESGKMLKVDSDL